jgi:hypothetical protein
MLHYFYNLINNSYKYVFLFMYHILVVFTIIMHELDYLSGFNWRKRSEGCYKKNFEPIIFQQFSEENELFWKW